MNNTIFSLTPPTLTHCHTLRSARQPRCTTQCSGSIYLPLFPSQSSSDHTNTFAAFRIAHQAANNRSGSGWRSVRRTCGTGSEHPSPFPRRLALLLRGVSVSLTSHSLPSQSRRSALGTATPALLILLRWGRWTFTTCFKKDRSR